MALLEPLIVLASQVCGIINTQEIMKYPSQLVDLKMQIQEELAKGYDSDDAKVEDLYEKIAIITQAIQNEFSIYQAKGGAPAPLPAGGLSSA